MPVLRPGLPILLFAAATASAGPPASRPADDVWRRLESPDFAVREAATDALWRQGESARPALVHAAGPDGSAAPDAQERCRRVLWLLDLGLTPATPQPARDAIADYDYAASPGEKSRRLTAALSAGRGIARTLIRLALDEPSPDVRRRLYGMAGADAVAVYARRLIDAGDDASLGKLATAFALAGADGGTLTLDMVLADDAGRLADNADTWDNSNLGVRLNAPMLDLRRLLRERFALGQAEQAIRDADHLESRFQASGPAMKLRIAVNDFAEVLKDADPVRSPSLRAAALAVTGDTVAAETAVREIVARAADADPIARRQAAKLCLLLGLVPEGVDLFGKLGEARVLAVQGRWAEAMALKAPTDNGGEPDATTAPRLRLPAEQDDVRRTTGLLPPRPRARVPAPGPAAVALDAAAARWQSGDADAALAAVADALPARVPHEPLPEAAVAERAAALLLRAACLDKLDRGTEADADRRTARRYAATADAVWVGLIGRLDSAGLGDLADAEAERLGRFRPDGDWANAALCERAARRATRRGDFAAAARARDRQLLWHALGLGNPNGGVGYVDAAAYLSGPYVRDLAHARRLLAAGDRPAAVERLRHALLYQPIDGALAIEFVHKLDSAGDKASADAIYAAVWDRQQPLIAAYPRAASIRNTAAWTMLRTGRRTAEAMKLSAEAVTLRPDEPAYLDTYAEALFVTGQKDAAIDAMRRVVTLLPDDKTTRERLAGFEQGKIVVPDEPE